MDEISKNETSIRNSFADWSQQFGSSQQQELYLKWHEYKRTYFDDAPMVQPIIEIDSVSTLKTMGEYAIKTGSGLTGKITIKESIVSGRYLHLNLGADPTGEGHKRFVLDILLHEMVHQFIHEILGKSEPSYSGHGPVFKEQCNRIGDIIGLPLVRDCKRRGRYAELPSCAHWPHNVRPIDYYKAVYQPKEQNWGSEYSIVRVPFHLREKVETYIASFGVTHA